MNLVLDYDTLNTNNIYFNDSIKNTIMDNSKFIRILYSDENIILNGLFLKIYKIENININIMLEKINLIENNLLSRYNKNKYKVNKIREQLNYLFKKKTQDKIFILKISGIWETETMIGITYKFILDSY